MKYVVSVRRWSMWIEIQPVIFFKADKCHEDCPLKLCAYISGLTVWFLRWFTKREFFPLVSESLMMWCGNIRRRGFRLPAARFLTVFPGSSCQERTHNQQSISHRRPHRSLNRKLIRACGKGQIFSVLTDWHLITAVFSHSIESRWAGLLMFFVSSSLGPSHWERAQVDPFFSLMYCNL